MTTLARNQPPPPDDWKVTARGAPLCQVCEKPLTVKWLKDPQLGPCCMECAPHVISADKLLYFMQISFRKKSRPLSLALQNAANR
jgi:hypothetical protein